MIHPSTMAGPNWFTGSFGTTNPFQQNTSPFFRNTPFQGPQGGFGFGTNPFQNPTFGFGNPYQNPSFGFGTNPFQNPNLGFGNTPQFQNSINEIVRQTIPTIVSSFGYQPTTGFQPSFGTWNPTGFATPNGTWSFGTQFSNTPFSNDWQTQNIIGEIIRQTTNQTIQSFPQLNPGFGFNPQQQNIWNTSAQIAQQACWSACQTTCQAIITCAITCINQQNTPNAQQSFWNICIPICQQACQQVCQTVCQSVITCANTCINQQNPSFSFGTQNTPFNINTGNIPYFNPQNTPFSFTNPTPQFSFTPGIPTGVGAF